jgi:hypothetical protein
MEGSEMSTFDYDANCSVVIPELPVTDLSAAQHWFQEMLAFKTAWVWENSFAAVQCGDVQLYLRVTPSPISLVRCYLHVKNADAVHELCSRHNATIVDKVESKPWGAREFAVQSPDGHVLRIGHGEKGVDEISNFTLGERQADA